MVDTKYNEPMRYMFSAIQTIYKADLTIWPQLVKLIDCLVIEEGEHWFRAGDYCSEFAFIAGGLLRLYYVDEKGKELIEGFYEQDKMLGPISAFVSDSPCPFYVQALETTTLVTFNYKGFVKLADEIPELLKFQVQILQNLFLNNAKRDAKRILCDGEQRYLWFCREYPHLIDRVAQYHIASFLRMTPVTLSRLRKKLHVDK